MHTNAPSAPLAPQDLLLTIFGAYVRLPGEEVSSRGMVEILGELGFSTEAARAALARLATRGLLARRKHGRLVSYTLTTRAERVMADGDRRIFSFGRSSAAPERWTVLWHAIPDGRRVERARLASRLRFLGFGSVADATWVAASNREQEVVLLLRELDVEPFASLLVGRLSHPRALVAVAWDLDAVAQAYREFVAQFGPYRAPRGRRGLDPPQAFAVRTLLLHRFRAFASSDPELGSDGLRARALATFDEVYAALAESANAHFRAVAQAPTS